MVISAWSVMRAVLKNTIRVVIYIPLLLLVTAALLIGTPFGSRITVMLANAFVPNVSVHYKSGSLNRDIELSDASWFMDGVHVAVTDFKLGWQASCLLNGQLCVSQLQASSVNVAVDTNAFTSDTPKKPTSQPRKDEVVTLPFAISLEHAKLNQVKVRVDDMHFNAKQLILAADWPREGIRVHNLTSQGLLVDIPLSGSGHNQPTSPQDEHTASVEKWAMAHLPRVFNPVPVIVDHAALTDSLLRLGHREDHFAQLDLIGQYLGTLVEIGKLHVKHPLGKADIKGRIDLSGHYPLYVNAKTHLNANNLIKGLKQQNLSLLASGDFSHLALTVRGNGDTRLSLKGNVNLANPEMPYQIFASANKLRWPLTRPQYVGKEVQIISSGSLSHQQLVTSGEFTTPYFPATKLATELKNHISSSGGKLDITHLSLLAKDSALHISGLLDYIFPTQQQPLALDWQGKVQSQKLRPEMVTLPDHTTLPRGHIDASFTTMGHYDAHNWQVGLSQMAIYGQLAGYPLDLSGDLTLDNSWHIKTDSLIAKALGAEFQASGQVNDNWRLQGKLSVPTLSPWLKNAAGKLEADIDISGDQHHPKARFTAKADHLVIDGVQLAKARIIGWMDLLGQNAFELVVHGNKLQLQQYRLTQVELHTNGNRDKQQLILRSQGALGLRTHLNSTYDEKKKQLDLVLDTLDLQSKLGRWKLDKPVIGQWSARKNQGSLSAFCLTNGGNQLCLDNPVALAPQGNAQISFSGNPGHILTPFMPPRVLWNGPAKLLSTLNWAPQQKPSASMVLDFEPGNITVSRTEQPAALIPYRGAHITAQLDAQQFSVDADINAGELAQLNAHVAVNVTPDRQLKGKINIDKVKLDGLLAFLPQLATLKGQIASHLTLGGTLSDPLLSGKVQLNDGAFSASANPTLADKINLELGFAGKQAHIHGNWHMGAGEGQLKGDLNWQDDNPRGNVSLKGQSLAVIFPPLAIVQVSPDLHIRFSPKGTNISGNINIPAGQIKIVQMAAGGVPVSSDLVYKDSISAAAIKQKPYPISMDLNIQVANKVSIEGMGLTANLGGTLTLQQQPLRPPMLFGEIQVFNGSYRFLGQKLDINTGELQFVGPPAMPNLNIEAVRHVKEDSGEVSAGIRITGTPRKPSVTLFSNPAMEQAEILSYIIKGSGFNNKEQNDALMMSAALSLSAQLGKGAIGNLGDTATNLMEKVGISNIQLDANDDGRVAISGYLGKRLMVKYGIGVFNPGYELTVRYYLMSRLYLETVSGSLEQSLDIYYSFDL